MPKEAFIVLCVSKVSMETKGPKMVRGNFSPEGRIKQTLKDVRLMLDQAASVGQKLSLLEVHADVLEAWSQFTRWSRNALR